MVTDDESYSFPGMNFFYSDKSFATANIHTYLFPFLFHMSKAFDLPQYRGPIHVVVWYVKDKIFTETPRARAYTLSYAALQALISQHIKLTVVRSFRINFVIHNVTRSICKKTSILCKIMCCWDYVFGYLQPGGVQPGCFLNWSVTSLIQY